MSTYTVVMSVTRTRNPRGQGQQLRLDLLRAAADLMAERGSLDAVSLRAVAARAGVSPTAVYRHFDDHHQLLQGALMWCWNEFGRVLDIAVDPDVDPFTQFTDMGRAYARFAAAESGRYGVLMASHRDMGPETLEAAMAVFIKLVDRVGAMLAANDDPRDPFFVATQVFTWIHGIVDICRDADETPFPAADTVLDDLAVRLGLYPGGS